MNSEISVSKKCERMSEEMYAELKLCMKKEVCMDLSRRGFGDYNSMLYSLGVGVDMDVVSKEVDECIIEEIVAKSVMLPWCGVVLSGRCNALVLNGGLYTQCMKESELYCKGCVNKKEKNGGVFVYGTVEDRLRCGLLEYKDSKGKGEVLYSKVMKKEGISREEAELAAGELGWVIPESYFELCMSSKRGRPKKNVEKEIVEKKARGRPKKEKETIVGNVGEDLIASLMDDIVLEENVGEDLKSSLMDDVVLDENVVDVLCLENMVDVLCLEEKLEEESAEETEVKRFEYNGKSYYKSEDNVLFDIESHDCVGVWNGKSIDDIEEEED